MRRVMCRTYQRWPRHRQRETELTEAAERALTVSPPEDPTGVLHLLPALPRRQRAVVVLRYLADLPEEQVAQLLDISRGTVKSQASRATAKLREQMKDVSDEERDRV